MRGRRIACSIALATLLSLAAGCTRRLPAFPKLVTATEIQVRDSEGRVTTITDAQRVAAIVHFFDDRTNSWVVPGYGTPVGKVRFAVYDGKQLKGSFGVGRGFLDCQRQGVFGVRWASDQEVQEVLELAGLPDSSLN